MTARPRPARRVLAAAVSVLVAATALSLAPGTAAAVGSGNEALLLRNNAFIRNSYAEVGARPNGSFGSSTLQPAGWHGNITLGSFGVSGSPQRSGVGFRSDRGKDGWDVGTDDGDFFTPGQPYESWSVSTSGRTAYNSNKLTGVVGSFISSDSAGDPSVVWDSSDAGPGVTVRQVASVPADGTQQLNIDVTLTNPTGSDRVARYGRAVDPDNCVHRGVGVCDRNGNGLPDNDGFLAFETRNTIKSQRTAGAATSAVGATQIDGSELVLWTPEQDSKVVGYVDSVDFCDTADLARVDAVPLTATPASPTGVQCGTAFAAVGSSFFGDRPMSLVVRKTVPANGSVTFRVSYSLSTAAYESVVTPENLVDLSEGPLDTGTVGIPYTFDLAAIGIATPTFTVSSGSLPAGLTLDPATGAISGTPTTAGDSAFSVTASGTEGSVTKDYTVTILAAPGVPPTWTANTLPDPVKGQAFSSGVTATADGNAPGTGAITYEIQGAADSLPAGLSLDPTTGAVTGTPTASGPYDFTIVATNEFGFVTQQFTGTIGVPPTWTDTTLGTFVKGQAFSGAVAAVGDAPITYTVDTGTLPAGLTLDPATGAVTGTPTGSGTYTFTLKAENPYGSVTYDYTGTIGVPPTWTDNTLGTPTAARPYADQVAAAGTGPITYAVTAGRLPAGLTLNPTTGAVTGTPTAPGRALFIVTATNAYGSVTQGFGFDVAPRPRTTARGTVFFVGATTRPTADGTRVLARLVAAAPRGATNVRVTVEGWAQFRRGPQPVVERLAARRVTYTTGELRRRGLTATFTGRTGGRYPVPGPTGRRAEVTVSWDTPG